MNTSFIEKELVSYKQFSKREALSEGYAIAQRNNTFERAVLVCNIHKVKRKIFFETQEGSKIVVTTIWAATIYIIIKEQRHSVYCLQTANENLP